VNISANRATPGDKIILSGFIGDHGMAILSQRENLEFEGVIESDWICWSGIFAAFAPACRFLECLHAPGRESTSLSSS
jgi:hydrogenase expression/formation protein HypE